jgi:hypothetical protein
MTWPNSNYGHYGRLETDGISDWHPAFLQLAPTLTGCSKRYEWFCKTSWLPYSNPQHQEHKAEANATGTALVSNHCHSTYPYSNTYPSSGSKSPSSFVVAMLHAGMMMAT